MDFDSLLTSDNHEKGAECNIINPNTGEPTDVFIKIMGPDSKEFRRARKESIKRMFDSSKKDDSDEEVEKMVAVTIGWRGLVKDGKEYEFSKKAARDLYTRAPNVMDQLTVFVADYKNFIKG